MGTCCTLREAIEIERKDKSSKVKLYSEHINLYPSSQNRSITNDMSNDHSIQFKHKKKKNISGPILELLMKNAHNNENIEN